MRAKEAMKHIRNIFGWDNDPALNESVVHQVRVLFVGAERTIENNDPTVEGSAAFYKEGRDLLKADNDRLNAELADLKAHPMMTVTYDPTQLYDAGIAARDLVIADLRKENTYLKECHAKAHVYFPSIDECPSKQEVS